MKLGKQAQALLDQKLHPLDRSEITPEEMNEIGRRVALANEGGYMGLAGYTREQAAEAEARQYEKRDRAYDLTEEEKATIATVDAAEAEARNLYNQAVRAKLDADRKAAALLRPPFDDPKLTAGRRAQQAAATTVVRQAESAMAEAHEELAEASRKAVRVRNEAHAAARRRGDLANRQPEPSRLARLKERLA